LHIWLESFFLFDCVDAVKVRVIEIGSLDPPNLVVHLLPLRCRIDTYLQIGE
jgi:hypothetical protein